MKDLREKAEAFFPEKLSVDYATLGSFDNERLYAFLMHGPKDDGDHVCVDENPDELDGPPSPRLETIAEIVNALPKLLDRIDALEESEGRAIKYLSQLLTSLWPGTRPLEKLNPLISQIDNGLTELTRLRDQSFEADENDLRAYEEALDVGREEAESELSALKAKNAELESALKPFAIWSKVMLESELPHMKIIGGYTYEEDDHILISERDGEPEGSVFLADLRRAKTVMESEE